ncbi:MAG: hypothetical protein ACP5JU_02675 [Minisyncoccia bacterium]
MRNNKYYWEESLNNPELIVDYNYENDEIILDEKELISKTWRLRDLITTYCVLSKIDENTANQTKTKILYEIIKILKETEKIQYTEFVAYWKTLDFSYSMFKGSSDDDQKTRLSEIIEKYCEKRLNRYNKLGYTDVIVQSLYDTGASRKKGKSGIDKLLEILRNKFENISRISNLNNCRLGYFLPDQGDKELFEKFKEKFKLKYEYGEKHQGKNPDIVLIVDGEFLIIEAKHVKEAGGAQNKQILELIEFISYPEENQKVHYVSFLDGPYFNKFIYTQQANADNNESEKRKVTQQRENIEMYLKKNQHNFFVNTHGFRVLLNDLEELIRTNE